MIEQELQFFAPLRTTEQEPPSTESLHPIAALELARPPIPMLY
jgi:hypothetical protein